MFSDFKIIVAHLMLTLQRYQFNDTYHFTFLNAKVMILKFLISMFITSNFFKCIRKYAKIHNKFNRQIKVFMLNIFCFLCNSETHLTEIAVNKVYILGLFFKLRISFPSFVQLFRKHLCPYSVLSNLLKK